MTRSKALSALFMPRSIFHDGGSMLNKSCAQDVWPSSCVTTRVTTAWEISVPEGMSVGGPLCKDFLDRVGHSVPFLYQIRSQISHPLCRGSGNAWRSDNALVSRGVQAG